MPEPLVIPIKIDAKGIEQELKNITEKLTFDFNLKVSGKGGGSKTSDYVSQETTEKESVKIGKEQLKNQEKEEKNREKENKQKEKEEKKRHKETVSIFKGVARGLGIGLGVASAVRFAKEVVSESYEYGKTFANFATGKGISVEELTNATKLFAGLGATEQEQLDMANYVLAAQQAYALRGEGPLKTNLYGRYAGLSAGLENLSVSDYLKEMNRYFQENLKNATPAQQREFLRSAFGSETASGMALLNKTVEELQNSLSNLPKITKETADTARGMQEASGEFWHNLKTDITNFLFGGDWGKQFLQERKSGEGFISSLALSSGSRINDFFSNFAKENEENMEFIRLYSQNERWNQIQQDKQAIERLNEKFKSFTENSIERFYEHFGNSIDASQNMTVIVNGNMTEDMLERTATEVGGMSYPNMSYFSGGVLK